MKIEGRTIPALQNIKRREAYLLTNYDKLPKSYAQAQLLRIARIRSDKRLRWETSSIPKAPLQERIKETANVFTPIPKKQSFIDRVKGTFKSQRGN